MASSENPNIEAKTNNNDTRLNHLDLLVQQATQETSNIKENVASLTMGYKTLTASVQRIESMLTTQQNRSPQTVSIVSAIIAGIAVMCSVLVWFLRAETAPLYATAKDQQSQLNNFRQEYRDKIVGDAYAQGVSDTRNFEDAQNYRRLSEANSKMANIMYELVANLNATEAQVGFLQQLVEDIDRGGSRVWNKPKVEEPVNK